MTEIKPYDAPGRPSTTPPGIMARKQGTGTAAGNDSRVWFTVFDGTIGDISFPSPNRACVRTLKLIVADDSGFLSDETVQGFGLPRPNSRCVPDHPSTGIIEIRKTEQPKRAVIIL